MIEMVQNKNQFLTSGHSYYISGMILQVPGTYGSEFP